MPVSYIIFVLTKSNTFYVSLKFKSHEEKNSHPHGALCIGPFHVGSAGIQPQTSPSIRYGTPLIPVNDGNDY